MMDPLVCACRGDLDCGRYHPPCTLCGCEAEWMDGSDYLCRACAERRKEHADDWKEEGLADA